MKLTHIALIFAAASSFHAVANTYSIVQGSESVTSVDIEVSQVAFAGLTITPEKNLTDAAVKLGSATKVASFQITGDNAAVRFLDADSSNTACSYIFGKTQSNKIQVCLADTAGGQFADGNGFDYYKYDSGKHYIVSGDANKTNQYSNVQADSYELKMEVVTYSL